MVLTRSQVKARAVNAALVASPGVHSPLSQRTNLQGNAVVADTNNDLGGDHVNAAWGGDVDDVNTGFILGSSNKKCKRRRCETCDFFVEGHTVCSSVTRRRHSLICNRDVEVTCKTSNVVYLIECNKCHVQYVGESGQELSSRVSDHKTRLYKHDATKKETVLIRHFHRGACKDALFSIRIVEVCEGEARKGPGKPLDPEVTRKRRAREAFWIRRLHTLYPYGLNDRLDDNIDQRDESIPVLGLLAPKYNKQKLRGKKKGGNKNTTEGDKLYADLEEMFSGDITPEMTTEAIRRIYGIVPRMSKKEIKVLGEKAMEDIYNESNIPERVLHCLMDLAKFKLFRKQKSPPPKPKKRIEHPFKITYTNHWIGKLKIGDMIHEQSLKDSLPKCVSDRGSPSVILKYTQTVRWKLLNYKRVIENFKFKELRNMSCECLDSEFKDDHHQHVVTGDLRIIRSLKLQNLFRKGPNFREPEPLDWRKARVSLMKDLDKFIDYWSDKLKLAPEFFLEWKVRLIGMIDRKYAELKPRTRYKPASKVLKDPECIKELEEIHSKFVLVPIDKASNNIGFVCKKYFLETLVKETESDTYEEHVEKEDEIIKHIVEECQSVRVKAGEVNHQNNGKRTTRATAKKISGKLPCIHATIKMHKSPVKFRFIIGDRQSIMKPLAKKMVSILSLVMNTLKRYCDKIQYFTGINHYWIANSNAEVLEDIRQVNARRNARNIACFDFSTLYTKIPLEDLKQKLKEIVEKAFKGGTNQYIQVKKSGSKWFHKKSTESVSKEDIFNMIDVIIDNSFFKLGDKCFRQCIGIPMGIDPAPQMANLYLHYYEFQFMDSLKKTDNTSARRFSKTKRYIDDLQTINNDGTLSRMHEEGRIYPREMQLNKENVNDQKATFLDLNEAIVNKQIIVKVYDKRDDYNFEIVNYPHLSSNIPLKAAYGVFSSQIIRYARICSLEQDLENSIKALVGKLVKKGYSIEGLKYAAKTCFRRHPWILDHVSIRPYRKFLDSCIVV